MNRDTVSNPTEQKAPEKVIPIVFSTDDNYVPYAGVAIQSIVLNANPHNIYRIFVLYDSLSAEHIEALEGLSTKNITVQCRPIENLMHSIRTSLPTARYISKATYYRILIPEIEEFKSYPCIVYLDCDLIVNTDIAGIVPQSMGNALIAGVRDYSSMESDQRKRLERDFRIDAEQYVNAGVLVINVPQWIQENTARKCFDFLAGTPSEKLLHMDQDIINAVCKGRILYLDVAWNYSWYWVYGEAKIVARCRPITDRIGENFHILHFAAWFKPWTSFELPLARYFWMYAGQSPFYKEIIEANFCSRADLENNLPYIRVGRAITFLPRKLLGGIRCIRDHGAGYTVRRTLYHIGLWKDEEKG